MADSSQKPTTIFNVELDEATAATLRDAAAERQMRAEELVARWVRERLAHEAERRLGRARPQRPDGGESRA